MASDEPDETGGRDWPRVALVVCCALAAVVAALLVPTLAADELAGTPIDSVLPGERFDSDPSGGAGGSGGGFGALDPGDSTGAGGDTGFDNDTFGSNDTEVHFEVESTEPAYWRTASYDTYTGTGWERDGEAEPYDPPLEPEGLTDGTVEFEVTLAEPASAVPTVWQPYEISGLDELEVTDDAAVRSNEALEPGTTFSAVSQAQENDVELLRSAGDGYPDELHERYTQLPEDTPDRVGEFTEELVEDDETAYDAAMSIQSWLREEKGYSLQASETGDDVADHFIFEMEEGYCEYFATAMTTMLRSQEIPARYAVGYGTGQPVGENSYEVRGMNAHAWVEVYFPDVGWVAFDPTPGDARLEMEGAVLEEEGEEFEPEDPGSPGEEFDHDPDAEPEDEPTDGYEITLNRTAVPGEPVEIEVTDDGEPLEGLVVTVNDEEVGTTDAEGTVVMTVPDETALEISVHHPAVSDVVDDIDGVDFTGLNEDEFDGFELPDLNGSDDAEVESVTGPGFESVAGPGVESVTDSRVESVMGSSSGAVTQASSGGDRGQQSGDQLYSPTSGGVTAVTVEPDEQANETVPVETDATVSVSGDALPGETVTVSVTVDGVPIGGATVTLDGEEVARTDDGGRADVTLPTEPDDFLLAAERGPVSGEQTLSLPGIELDVDTGLVALPFTTATATVTADDESVANATVALDGQGVATTGPDGTADVRLPLSSSATVEASAYGLSDTETVDGLVRNLAVGVLAGWLLVAVPAVALSRRGHSPGSLLSALVQGARRLSTYAQLALIVVVRDGGGWGRAAAARLRRSAVYLFDAARGRRGMAELRALLAAWLGAKRRELRSAVDDEPDKQAVAAGVRRGWQVFLSHLSVRDPSAHTPAELAHHAIEVDGLPPDAVETVLEAFRAVEYGGRPEADRLAAVDRAVARLEADHRATDTPATAEAGALAADGRGAATRGEGRVDGEPTGVE